LEKDNPDSTADNSSNRTDMLKLANLTKKLEQIEIEDLLIDLLQEMNLKFEGNRSANEIAKRFFTKIKRQAQSAQIGVAVEFMVALSQIVGEPYSTLNQAEKLLSLYNLKQDALNQLRNVLELLQHYHVDFSKLVVDLGISRGVNYYTGLLFEIYHTNQTGVGEGIQICGGGRYDNLVMKLGGRADVGAAGFSFGVERVLLALENENPSLLIPIPKTLLIAPVSPNEYGYAIQIAELLRNEGISVEIDVRTRSVSSNLQYADKRGLPFMIIVGETEKSSSQVVLRNLLKREELRVNKDDIASVIKSIGVK